MPRTFDLTKSVVVALRGMSYREATSVPVATVMTRLVRHAQRFYGRGFNFEHLLHVLETADGLRYAWGGPGILGEVAEGLLSAGPSAWSKPLFEGYLGALAQSTLLDTIHEEVVRSSASASSHPEWSTFQSFAAELEREFHLSVVTLNYDTLFDTALRVTPRQQGFAAIPGEKAYRFDPRLLARRPRLMHLHGSIHFGDREYGSDANKFAYQDGREDVYMLDDPTATRSSAGGSSNTRNQAGRGCVVGPLITGLQKADKLLGEPYSTYYSRFSELVATSERLLVVGYGFGDIHVNAILRRMTKLHKDRRVASITRFDPVAMHGSWGQSRGEEHRTVAMWSEQNEVFRERTYTNPWRSANGFVRVYYDGLRDVTLHRVRELVEFLAS